MPGTIELVRSLGRLEIDRLRHLALLGSPTDGIAEAIERLRREFHQPLRIESRVPAKRVDGSWG